jgi:hypothetical protein
MKKWIFIFALVLSGAPICFGQEVKLQALLNGKTHPLTLKLKELNAEWSRVNVSSSSDVQNWTQMYGSMLGASRSHTYTKGETVSLGGETYLVGYRLATKPVDITSIMRGQTEPNVFEEDKLTPDTLVHLTYLNVRNISSLSDIRPFVLDRELGQAEAGSDGASTSFQRARKRAQATTILNEARMMDAAKDQWALENNKTGTATPGFSDLTPYLKAGSKLATNDGKDSFGNPFSIGDVSTAIRVSPKSKEALSEVTGGNSFWGPYS